MKSRYLLQTLLGVAASFCLALGLMTQTAQASQGQTVFIPIAVGDITTFIPIMPAASCSYCDWCCDHVSCVANSLLYHGVNVFGVI